MSPCVPVMRRRCAEARRFRGVQQGGTGECRARGSRRAHRCPCGEPRGAGAGTDRARGVSPQRIASDLSPATARRKGCAAGRWWKCGSRCRPSSEPAVHGPSFPAAARASCRCAGAVLLQSDPTWFVRREMRGAGSDESRKMIRAPVTLSAPRCVVSTESACARAQNARRRHPRRRVLRARRALSCVGCSVASAPRSLPPRPSRREHSPQPRLEIGTTARSGTPV
jgi:hypothetical protein